jgi:hypothetical protein
MQRCEFTVEDNYGTLGCTPTRITLDSPPVGIHSRATARIVLVDRVLLDETLSLTVRTRISQTKNDQYYDSDNGMRQK